jgi:hypothetical protein
MDEFYQYWVIVGTKISHICIGYTYRDTIYTYGHMDAIGYIISNTSG